jgi:hypothetical protein
MSDQEKRQLRKMKRDLKQAGNRLRRRLLQRDLRESPEEATQSEPDIGPLRSEVWNGIDRDVTRRRHQKPAQGD